jgi:TfoX/Sxy family transcriptional regulator of competence genes
MALDEDLVDRVRRSLVQIDGVDERKVLGGLGFLIDGNVACSVVGDELVVRVGPDEVDEVVERAGVERFEVNGQVMPGFVVVTAAHVDDLHTTAAWVKRGLVFASTLSPKETGAVPKTVKRSRRTRG